MWDQWKKKINDFLFVETDETDETDERPTRSINHKKQQIQTRMTYQYPENKSFRFPVIPDQSRKEETIEVPAFKRKKRNRSESDYPKSNKTVENTQTKQTGNDFYGGPGPFKPSAVPSPIYGYNRKKETETENIPAYQRKQQEEENKLPNEKHETEAEQPTEENDTYLNKSVNEEITIEEKPAESNSVADKQPEQQEIKQNPISQSKRKPVPRSERRRSIGKNKHEQNEPKAPPFNVMMSANDKRRQAEKGTQNKANTIVEKKSNVIPYHLLNDPSQENEQDQIWKHNQQELLEKTLKHFNVRAKVVNATQGPSVTRFEVQPEMGVKVSKVKNLSDDIKLNMAAKDIRIEAPIPGKNTIGIEIPNPVSQTVGLQEIFGTKGFQSNASPLTIALGLNIEGSPLITNIQKMPHGLIAGATGSGKSVCINTILISLLYKAHYEDVKFLLIDPKMVELAPYNGIPHLISPVITDVKAATVALKWAVKEMEDRYDRFVQEGVRDIARYNQKVIKQNRANEKMPFIVIVIDELADLMMVSPQDVEDAICRIAQKARACGIHLLLATQRPSVDVITGLIKANIPTRIAFSVSSQVDSRTIMDTSGAEKLLGKGDMLFIENGAGKSTRLQGAFVSDEEIERITDYVRSIAEPNYEFEQEQLLEQIATEDHEDELLHEAIQFVVNHNSASTSLLQRHFKIGYNRAARLMDAMENKEIIAQQNGSKPRDVLVSKAHIEG